MLMGGKVVGRTNQVQASTLAWKVVAELSACGLLTSSLIHAPSFPILERHLIQFSVSHSHYARKEDDEKDCS